MSSNSMITQARKALKLIKEVERSHKEEGLDLLEDVLKGDRSQLVDYGYDKLILKELLKSARFEEPPILSRVLEILCNKYSQDECDQDELMETLLYVYGLTTRFDIAEECINQILVLIDLMDDNIAKHSKQLIQAADTNNFISLNQKFIELLEKLKQKLPKRKV